MRKVIHPEPSIIEKQHGMILQIKQRMRERIATAADPLIVLNPFGASPLTALICFDTPEEDQFVVTVAGHTESADLSYMGGAYSRTHRIPVLGLYPGGENTVRLRNRSGDERTYQITTEALPAEVVPLSRGHQPPYNTLLFFLPADGLQSPCAFDVAGDCRWFYTQPLAHRFKLDREGLFLTGAPPLLAPPYGATALWQMDLLGRVRKEFRIPGGFCCDFFQLPDRTIITVGEGTLSGTVADHIHWVDHRSGEILQTLDLATMLTTEGGNPAQSGTDWFQARTLQYDEETHRITVSGVAQSILLEIDAATARPLRLFGNPGLVGDKEGLMQDMPEDTVWPQEPYGGLFKGDYLYYLNANRYSEKGDHPGSLSLVIQDLKKQHLIEIIDEPRFPVSPLFNSLKMRLDGALEIHAGSCSQMSDRSQPKEPGVFNLMQYPDTALWSERIVWREDRVIAKETFPTNSLHSEEVEVPALRFVSLDEKAGLLGQWPSLGEVDVDLPIAQEEALPEDMAVHLWRDDARLYIKSSFFQGEMCLLVLRQGAEERKYFIQSSRRPYGADWLFSYPEGMERPVLWAVPVHHLSGEWEVGLLIDDVYYDTGYTLLSTKA